MKTLACIGSFALGAIAGGYGLLFVLGFGVEYRVEHPVDDEAIFYEDDNTKVVRVSTKRESDKVDLAVIIHKDNA